MRWPLGHLVRTRLVPLLVATLVVTGSTAATNMLRDPVTRYLSGQVVIGINGNHPGWSYPRGDPDGFDVELARFLAHKYGFRMKLVPLSPDQRETKLRNGDVDLVIANFSIDGKSWLERGRKRLDVLDFAGPYFKDNSGVMYSEDKLRQVDPSLDAIPADHVCAANGTTAQDYLGGQGVPEDEVDCFRRFADKTDLRIVGVVTDQAILTSYAHEFGGTAIPAIWKDNNPSRYPISKERYGIGMPNGNPELCRELTKAINEFLSGGRSSPWQRAFDNHLYGVSDPEDHKPAQAESQLCDHN